MNCGVTVILKYRNMIVNLRVTAAENSFLSRCTFYYLTVAFSFLSKVYEVYDSFLILLHSEY